MKHVPVLTSEVLKYLTPKPNENFIDGTIGQAGHTLLLLEKNGPDGKVLGIDLDSKQIENSQPVLEGFKNRMMLVADSYKNIKEIVEKWHFTPVNPIRGRGTFGAIQTKQTSNGVNGILLDLGYSSWQLENSTKGFTFLKDEALDMRYDLQNPLTAQEIVNEYPEDEIRRILEDYGEEKKARQIARDIVRQRLIKKIESTFELKDIIEKAMRGRRGNINNATRTFQALRIAVNDELGSLTKALPDALSVLSSGGRLVVISFHSLEDRIVKKFFASKAKEGGITILTKKPVTASLEEVSQNPRARSAKLRAIIKI